MNDTDIIRSVKELMRQAGIGGTPDLCQLAGGRNNRVFKLTVPQGHFLLKQYFQSPDDSRDRLGAEFAFCEYCWSRNITNVPQPLAASEQTNMALYEFIEGRHIRPVEVTGKTVRQALNFYVNLNACRSDRAAAALPHASEACFSIEQHLERVGFRVGRLADMRGSAPVNRMASEFVRNQLVPEWRRVRDQMRRRAGKLNLGFSQILHASGRRLSPSDFGFHNCLRAVDGNLRFIDFEYAGWDDPAKTVCDFFCQIEVPVPMDYFETFASRATEDQDDAKVCLNRIGLLLPVYRIKWCCIALNDFLPVDAKRRRFACREGHTRLSKRCQLDKASEALARLLSARESR